MVSTPPPLIRLSPELLARSARHAARVVARARLRRVRLAAPSHEAPLGEDALHDFRVALRRLRTWLRAFRPELDDTVGRGTPRRLRRLSQRSGLARDLEVQVLWLTHPTVRLGPLATGAAASLATRLESERAGALTKALEEIAESLPRAGSKLDKQLRRYEVLVPLDASRDEPSMAVAMGRLLREGTALVRLTLDRVTAAEQALEAHQARLAVKHLRYLLESMGTVHRGGPGAADRLAGMQDALGVLHDRHVLAARVAEEMALPREGTPLPPTRRAFAALHAALERSASREFQKARRIANGRAFRAALVTVDRLATALAGVGAADAPEAAGATPTSAAPAPPPDQP
jgi:CHAD domain-containing protein